MANLLTKEAIDELVNLFSEGKLLKSNESIQKENYEKIQKYNFKSPNRFTKDQLRAIRSIYENFATALSSHLSGLLRKYCQIELVSVEEHTFSEFSSSLVNPVMLGIIDLQPLQGTTLMEMSHMMAYAIIDRLLGGSGQYRDAQRNYTEIEIALMDKLMGQFLDLMRDSWSRFCDVSPKLERIETNAQFAQIVPLNETIAIITFSAKIGDVEGLMNYCVPHMGIESVINSLKTKNPFFQAQMPKQDDKSEQIIKQIEKSTLNVVCNFSDTEITAKDIMSIQVGDVLMLDNKINDAVNLKINDMLKFRGMIGTKNNKLTIKVSEIVKGEI